MPTYFQPPRRKIGVITLVVTCAVAGLWIRGEYYLESIQFLDKQTVYSVRNFCGRIWFVQAVSLNSMVVPKFSGGTYNILLANGERARTENLVKWGLEQYGAQSGMPIKIYSIPYWPRVPSLTLLSAWLLLSKTAQPRAIPPVGQSAK